MKLKPCGCHKPKKHVHMFSYRGGEAKCSCGKYLQPDGRITDTVTGRKKRKVKRIVKKKK